jgi:diguanylate cyclase (GGDEF)-like protein
MARRDHFLVVEPVTESLFLPWTQEWTTNRKSRIVTMSWRRLPPLATVTAVLYGAGAVLLVAGVVTWVPGRNPRWVVTALAVTATLFFVWTVLRGRRFTTTEALVMIAVQLFTVGALTWTTQLSIGAYSNGTVLPVAAVYVIWFLQPAAGRIVLYVGSLWWFAAILHHDDRSLVGFALSLMVQTIVAAEVLAQLKARMDRLARTDQLTGTLNRRGIAEVLERELHRSRRRARELSVVSIDLDGLRVVNNTQGHTAGDRLLERATAHWTDRLRRRDAIGRTGGDEFLVVLPGTTLEQAEKIVEALAADAPGAWSAGTATVKAGDSVGSLLDRADQRMYVHKAARHGADVPAPAIGPTVHS